MSQIFQASNLATQNSRAIGIILPPSEREAFENPFYLEAIRGISQFCNKRQYSNTVITGRDDQEILQVIRTMTRSGQVDGFILLYSRQKDPIVDYLYSEGLLYVLIGKAYQFANQTIYIDNDNLLAGREAAEYLYGLGHRRIAYIGSDIRLMFSADRRSGCQLALLEKGLSLRPEYFAEVHSLSEAGEAPIRQLLQLAERPTAVTQRSTAWPWSGCAWRWASPSQRICPSFPSTIPSLPGSLPRSSPRWMSILFSWERRLPHR